MACSFGRRSLLLPAGVSTGFFVLWLPSPVAALAWEPKELAHCQFWPEFGIVYVGNGIGRGFVGHCGQSDERPDYQQYPE